MFPELLLDALWHCTSPERYEGILEQGGVLPEPDLLDRDRWGTGLGKEHYPFVRTLGGVSLFDFTAFNPEEYRKKYRCSDWDAFVPGLRKWEQTVWIKIHREYVENNFISGEKLLRKWHDENMHGHSIMPIIECAHIGKLEVNVFEDIYVYDKKTESFLKG
jgi:hypothetical protein